MCVCLLVWARTAQNSPQWPIFICLWDAVDNQTAGKKFARKNTIQNNVCTFFFIHRGSYTNCSTRADAGMENKNNNIRTCEMIQTSAFRQFISIDHGNCSSIAGRTLAIGRRVNWYLLLLFASAKTAIAKGVKEKFECRIDRLTHGGTHTKLRWTTACATRKNQQLANAFPCTAPARIRCMQQKRTHSCIFNCQITQGERFTQNDRCKQFNLWIVNMMEANSGVRLCTAPQQRTNTELNKLFKWSWWLAVRRYLLTLT